MIDKFDKWNEIKKNINDLEKTINSKRILKYHGKIKKDDFKKLKDGLIKFLY